MGNEIAWDKNGIPLASAYEPGTASPEAVAEGMRKLKAAFPTLGAGWYDVLLERVHAKHIGSQRFLDAVDNLVDTCLYPEPTIGAVLSFDRPKIADVDGFTRERMVRSGRWQFSDFQRAEVDENGKAKKFKMKGA